MHVYTNTHLGVHQHDRGSQERVHQIVMETTIMPQRHTKKANAVDMIHEKIHKMSTSQTCRNLSMFNTIKNKLHAIATL